MERPEVGDRGRPDGATCERSSAEPDLSLSAAELGAVYLGGTRLAVLAQAGRVHAASAAGLHRGDAFFQGEVPPFCATSF